jgi:hypothetical protein
MNDRHPILVALDGAIGGFVAAALISLAVGQGGTSVKVLSLALILMPLGVLISLGIRAQLRRTLSGPDTKFKRVLEEIEENRRRDNEAIRSAFTLSLQNMPRLIAIIALFLLVVSIMYANEVYGLNIPGALLVGIGSLMGLLIFRKKQRNVASNSQSGNAEL